MGQGEVALTQEQLAWLKLNLIDELSSADFYKLLQYFKNISAVFQASSVELKAVLPKKESLGEKIVNFAACYDLSAELEQIKNKSINVLTLLDEDYPAQLRMISCPPPVLYLEGSLEDIDQAAVAIVGSRRATPYGILVAERLAAQLVERGITVISGFALGIDAAAHRGALSRIGRTIGVLGCGHGKNYPASNYHLGRKIVQNGALISEYPINTQPLPYNFPRRNRVISGLSLGVLVIEAAERSGSLSTANHALEQGREVFAVPGNINSRYSKGTNELIKAGAKLVNCCEDIIEELQGELDRIGVMVRLAPQSGLTDELSVEESQVVRIIEGGPKSIDEIIDLTKQAPASLLSLLSLMEIKGLIKQLPGKRYEL